MGGAVTVAVLVPDHIRGVIALPLTIRATARDKTTPVTAEAKVDVVK